MIPKVIHYIWLGGNQLPKIYSDCIKSWEDYAGDFEVKIWDEKNYRAHFGTDDFVESMLNKRKYAFAADYIRCQVLFEFGGVYLDTDMELVRSIEKLCLHVAFLGEEDINKPSCGILGCQPKFWLFGELMQAVKNANGLFTIPELLKNILDERQIARKDSEDITTIQDVTIYSEKFFYPYNPYGSAGRVQLLYRYVSKDCYAIHHWGKSWSLSFTQRLKRKLLKIMRRK
ncbi:TPA: glycosyltransferase family 32 protein [Enterobacter hormaechei]